MEDQINDILKIDNQVICFNGYGGTEHVININSNNIVTTNEYGTISIISNNKLYINYCGRIFYNHEQYVKIKGKSNRTICIYK